MKERSAYIRGYKDSYLHTKTFEPVNQDIRGVLHILHGMGEYGERYRNFAEYLVGFGIAVVTHDHRKHGKSIEGIDEVGILGKHDTHINMVKDIDYVQSYLRARYKDVPVYILGHSMGSILLRYYLTQTENDISKAILMGTLPKYNQAYIKLMRLIALLIGGTVSNKKRHRRLARMLNDGLAKKVPDAKTRLDWLSFNEANVKAYINDPLCGYAYNKRFYRSFFSLIGLVNKKDVIAKTKPVPIMLISGDSDPINDEQKALESVNESYENVMPNHAVFVHKVEHARHEVLNEADAEKTYAAIRDWLIE